MLNHYCDERTIDFAEVAVGHLVCDECGRRWDLMPSGWVMDPPQPPPLTRKKKFFKKAPPA